MFGSKRGGIELLGCLCNKGFVGELIIRRIQSADGRSRASINDQPASIGLLRRLGVVLAEIHGQHDDRALLDPALHRNLVDAFGGLETQRAETAELWRGWQAADLALKDH